MDPQFYYFDYRYKLHEWFFKRMGPLEGFTSFDKCSNWCVEMLSSCPRLLSVECSTENVLVYDFPDSN